MLDYTKITFNELDDTDKPQQAFYNYDLKENEIDSFLEEYATVEEVPEGVSIQKVELCLTIYAQHDLILEACCTVSYKSFILRPLLASSLKKL